MEQTHRRNKYNAKHLTEEHQQRLHRKDESYEVVSTGAPMYAQFQHSCQCATDWKVC